VSPSSDPAILSAGGSASGAADATLTPQLALWRSSFGQHYTDRNDVERPGRIDVWRRILAGTGVQRALEVGCNVGWNLRYLRAAGVPSVWGVEPQTYAIERARQADPTLTIVPGTAFALPFRDRWFDLAFTSGVLIHISPADLPRALDELYRVTDRWLAVIEYDHPEELEVSYRGHAGALWKRDHGAAIAARFPSLRAVASGFLGADVGYDDCTFHLFERTDRS
jgi:pseudaminic acid biosynthesis-associated methylase